MVQTRVCRIALVAVSLMVPVFAAGPKWTPDTTFKGASLTGWHTLGQAEWRVQNGEVVGTAKPGGTGGWLVLDRSYQDAAFYTTFRCGSGCRTGVLFRAEKTAEGMKGIYVSLTAGDVASYRVRLGPDGQELQRERLPSAPSGSRIVTPPPPAPARSGAEGGAAPARGGAAPGAAPVLKLPFTAPSKDMRPGDWNEVELMIEVNTVRAFLNDSNEVTIGLAEEENGRYGPIALYVGGTGEVRFRDIAYKDLAIRYAPAEQVSSRFRMQRLNEFYYAWSAAAADFNRDNVLDVVAGPYIYYGPEYERSREILPAQTRSPSREYPNDCMIQFASDFTGDGWPDVVCSNLGTPVLLYVNPKGESRRWDRYQVAGPVACEVWDHQDLDGDGKPEMIYTSREGVVFAKPNPANPTGEWILHPVSERGYATGHGIGVGDINGDKRPDIVSVFGWFENPGPGGKEPWVYHPEAFGRYTRSGAGGALMPIYDVNGDGLNDVVTSLGAHDVGLAWFEQKRDATGKISFTRHMLMDDFSTAAKNTGGVTFTQLHALAFADFDRDGVLDFIVGKRHWSHLESVHDPDAYGVPVLYLYRTVRNPKAPGGAEFVPELIHNHSGGGSNLVAVDLNRDGAVDIINATTRGANIFWGRPPAGAAKKAPASK